MVSQSFRLIATICLQVDIGLSYKAPLNRRVRPLISFAIQNRDGICVCHQLKYHQSQSVTQSQQQQVTWNAAVLPTKQNRNHWQIFAICAKININRGGMPNVQTPYVAEGILLAFMLFYTLLMLNLLACHSSSTSVPQSIHPSTSLLMNARLDLSKLSSCRPLHS